MKTVHRRRFLEQANKAGLGMAAAVTLLHDPRSVSAAPANDKVGLALVGAGGRGTMLARGFGEREDCYLAYVCDADLHRAEAVAKQVAATQSKPPKILQDFRKALDDPAVQAIVAATPDHWHAPAAVWACQAGKDVYTEKPASHNCWEGQKMVEAARKYKRVVQIGTQSRSAQYCMSAREYIRSGKLGKIHLCRVFNQKREPCQFPWEKDAPVPEGLDWDLWNGAAPEAPYNPTLHRHWRYLWRYAGGDLSNDGSHQIDLARWFVGVEHPTSVYSTGGQFHAKGASDAPDTQVTVWEYPDMLMTCELTLYTPYMLKISPYIRDSLTEFPYWPQCATRIEIYGDQGVMYVGRHGGGWQVFGRPKSEKPVLVAQDNGGFPDPEHKENFLQCLRSRQRPNADVEHGHRSALLIHYANISYRLGGQKLLIDPKTEHITNSPDAMKLFRREYRGPWTVPEVV